MKAEVRGQCGWIRLRPDKGRKRIEVAVRSRRLEGHFSQAQGYRLERLLPYVNKSMTAGLRSWPV